jgi:Protein of unknown function (DUF3761)
MKSLFRLIFFGIIISSIFAAPNKNLINAQDSTPAATEPSITALPKADPGMGTLQNPVPLGYVGHRISSDGKHEYDIVITEAYVGAEATRRLVTASVLNSTPVPASQYLLAYVEVAYTKGVSDAISIDSSWFFALANNRLYTEVDTLVPPDPTFNFTLFPGGEGEGWLAKTISSKATNPVLIWGADNSGQGGMYFSLTPSLAAPAATLGTSSSVVTATATVAPSRAVSTSMSMPSSGYERIDFAGLSQYANESFARTVTLTARLLLGVSGAPDALISDGNTNYAYVELDRPIGGGIDDTTPIQVYGIVGGTIDITANGVSGRVPYLQDAAIVLPNGTIDLAPSSATPTSTPGKPTLTPIPSYWPISFGFSTATAVAIDKPTPDANGRIPVTFTGNVFVYANGASDALVGNPAASSDAQKWLAYITLDHPIDPSVDLTQPVQVYGFVGKEQYVSLLTSGSVSIPYIEHGIIRGWREATAGSESANPGPTRTAGSKSTIAPSVTIPPTIALRSTGAPTPTTDSSEGGTHLSSDDGKGATAQCNDGTYWYAGTQHRGACSHHGGVAQFLR